MKKIPLSKGKYTIVDDGDFEQLSAWKWHTNARGYAMRTTHTRDADNKRICHKVYMHRQIINTPDGMLTDHINGDKLDNRRENLRVVTVKQNNWNTGIPSHNSTGVKGVYWRANRWEAAISQNNRKVHLGRFVNQSEAVQAYNKAALKLRGQYVRTAI